MEKFIDLWEPVLRQFKNDYPNYYEDMINWYCVGRSELVIILRDGRKISYEFIGSRIRFIQDRDCELDNIDETMWRENFARRLCRKMNSLGISRDRLSESTGISLVTVSKYMNARSIPSSYNMELLTKALDCTVQELTTIE